jgi:CRISPR/Cas system-associated exonuclease Cas4 (RecB family)
MKSVKQEGVVIPKLDKFLMQYSSEHDDDRGHGWNSPSSAFDCIRSQYYKRTNAKSNGVVSPRLRRIFDNGHDVHARNQRYLKKEGILLIDEVPVWNEEYQIAGHSDGLLQPNKLKLMGLEIKSINSGQFKNLQTAKITHKEQGQVYLFCLEELRKKVNGFKTDAEYKKFKKQFLAKYKKFMEGFVVTGSRFTKEEKIKYKLGIMSEILDILRKTAKRIEEMVFLYENKDNQELMEFVIRWDNELMDEIKKKYKAINKYVKDKKCPPRPKEATTKSCNHCRDCDYSYTCFH